MYFYSSLYAWCWTFSCLVCGSLRKKMEDNVYLTIITASDLASFRVWTEINDQQVKEML